MINSDITFQEAIEIVESFPEHQQEDLIEIVRHRLLERRRNILAENIRKAKKEYSKGDVNVGSVDDLLKELNQ
jgi:hypothetical protein